MDPQSRLNLALGLVLVVGNALFVAAEYALVGANRTRIESLAKRGNGAAKAVLKSLNDMSTYVAGIQTAITLFGLGLGAVLEPTLSKILEPFLDALPDAAISLISIIVVSIPLVVLGELVPKYATLQKPEQVSLILIRPLAIAVTILFPLIWLFKFLGAAILKPFGVNPETAGEQGFTKEELDLMLRGTNQEDFDSEHATYVSRALRLDRLNADDVMIHRVDIKWLEIDTPREELPAKLAEIPHSRIPVCREELDEIEGVIYLQDLVANWDDPKFTIAAVMRPAEFVPETLSADKLIQRMRDSKTQILIVRDEYGGTSGLLTLEDVIEEIFGELEDSLEAERAPIERLNERTLFARGDVRYDQVLEFLGRDDDEMYGTDTLGEIIQNQLGRVPTLSDEIETPVGELRVHNMARRRVTRVRITVSDLPADEE